MVPGVAVHRLVWYRNDAVVSQVAIEGPVSPTAVVVVAGQGEVLVAILVQPVRFPVEVGVH